MSNKITEEPNTGLTKDEVLSHIEKDIEQQKKNMDYMVSLKGELSSIDVVGNTTVTSNDLAEFHAKLAGDSSLNVKAPDTGLTKNEMLSYIEKGIEQQKKNMDYLDSLKEGLSNDEPSCSAGATVYSFLFYSHIKFTTAPSQGTKGYGNAGGLGVGTNVSSGTLSGGLTILNTVTSFQMSTGGVGLGWIQIQFFDSSSNVVAHYVGLVGTDVSIFVGGGSFTFQNV